MSLKEYFLRAKDKLISLKNRNSKTETREISYVYPSSDEELNSILISTVNTFFPTTGEWSCACFRRPNDFLQSNLRNNELLAKMILQKANLPSEYYDKVLNFINSSDLFKQKVHEYEQTIVKWQIQWIDGNGENWIVDENLGGDFCLIMPQCDIAFRKGVVDTLLAMGLNEEAIEEGLEKNADMWRNAYIERAFRIAYEPLVADFVEGDTVIPLKADSKHKEAWIRMRKYKYYLAHKRSVDLYGKVEPDMLLTQEEFIKLKSYLEIENAKRLELLKQYKDNKESVMTFTINI